MVDVGQVSQAQHDVANEPGSALGDVVDVLALFEVFLFLLLAFVIVFFAVTAAEVYLLVLLRKHFSKVVREKLFNVPRENRTVYTSAEQSFLALNVCQTFLSRRNV